jgi:hypothetical protein
MKKDTSMIQEFIQELEGIGLLTLFSKISREQLH